MNVELSFAAIGVAICDTRVFELRKPYLLSGDEGEGDLIELKALIEALNTAVSLGLKRLHILCHNDSVYQHLTGKGRPTNKIEAMVDEMNLIKRKFAYCSPFLVKQENVKFAFQFARDAIVSQATKFTENTSGKTLLEQCTICFEYTYITQMLSINKCQHRYRFSCMGKHVEAQLHLGKLAQCPHEGCKSDIEIESCKKFLEPKLYDIMSSRIKEDSIPPSEKVYCPFSGCSALMSKTEVQEHAATLLTAAREAGLRKCVKCRRFFCINCKVPSRGKTQVTCYKRTLASVYQVQEYG